MDETVLSITHVLSKHLNLQQHLAIDCEEIYFFLEKLPKQSLANKTIMLIDRSRFHLPSHINLPKTNIQNILLRVSSLYLAF